MDKTIVKMPIVRNLRNMGGTIALSLPKEVIEYMDISVDDEICIIGDEGKHGKFVAFWKREGKK